MNSNIYWVAVEEIPTRKDQEDKSALPKLVLPPTAVVARDDKDAALKVALGKEELKNYDQNRLNVIVRPF